MSRRRPLSAHAARAAAALAVVPDLEVADGGFATAAQAAAYLACSTREIRRILASRALPYAQHGKSRKIPWNALKAYAAAMLVRCDRTVAS